MAPVYATGYYFVVRLKEDVSIAQVVKERLNRRLDVEGVKPESEDSGFTLTFRVKVFNICLFFLCNGIKTGVGIKEIGYKSEIELWVACN
jgi:hypothetical protein